MTHRENIELWSGIECTVNRVGDVFLDQVERTGHANRLEDLDRLADLGVRAVRYPVLWERTYRGPDDYDFTWLDTRLNRLRELGIRVIAGLVHHGSGPRHTHLLDDGFVTGLEKFAGAVARRYPWLEDFTPVNEPLTTARFSALYGHWYPHKRDAASFLRALLVETEATIAAMRAIRKHIPNARLIQTEDFGSVFSTPHLKYQADFENHRKWLSIDLLHGRVGKAHPLFRYLVDHGIPRSALQRLEEFPCFPDLIGVNYYVTSDRFLDERVARYPGLPVGSNGRDYYVDTEAVRTRKEGIVGHLDVLQMTWNRYRTPMAVTEVHLGCTSEEQVRWFVEAWNAAGKARERGIDVRAVTLWSAFGAYDWDSLVTRSRGTYEAGAFDVRGPEPRPTALALAASELSKTGTYTHPLLDVPGWWRRSNRLFDQSAPICGERQVPEPAKTRPVLVIGRGGVLATAFEKACLERCLPVHIASASELNAAGAMGVSKTLTNVDPWLVINASGVPWHSDHFDSPEVCYRENVEGTRMLAEACHRARVRLVTFSSPLVFDGEKGSPYVESDVPRPTTWLGVSHAAAERWVTYLHEGALVVRTGAVFDVEAHESRLWEALRWLEGGEVVSANGEGLCAFAFAPELAQACLDLALAQTTGIVHLAHGGSSTLFEFLRGFARVIGVDAKSLVPATREHCRVWPHLPLRSPLGSERIASLSNLEHCFEKLSCFTREKRLTLAEGRAA
ncbi:MAG: sugar nucleotide-binding protein [Polyangiaceae bacterium]